MTAYIFKCYNLQIWAEGNCFVWASESNGSTWISSLIKQPLALPEVSSSVARLPSPVVTVSYRAGKCTSCSQVVYKCLWHVYVGVKVPARSAGKYPLFTRLK